MTPRTDDGDNPDAPSHAAGAAEVDMGPPSAPAEPAPPDLAPILSLVAERTDDAVVVSDPEGRLVWANAAFERLCGHPPATLRGRTVGERLQGPHSDRQALARLGEARRRGIPANVEVVNYHRAGHPYWVEIDLQPVRDDAGNVIYFIALERDITRRKRSEALTAARAAMLAALADGAGLERVLDALLAALEVQAIDLYPSIMLAGADGTLRCVTQRGLPPAYVAALEGLPIGPHEGSCGAAVYSGTRYIAVDLETDPNWQGYRTLAELSGMRACWSEPILGEGQEVFGSFAIYYRTPRRPSAEELGFIVQAADLAREAIVRKRQEAELHRYQQWRRLIFEQAPLAAIAWDPQRRVIEWNEAATQMFGYSREEALGRRVEALIASADAEARGGAVLPAGGEDRTPLATVTKDGRRILCAWYSTALRDADGGVVGVAALAQDVTEQTRARQDLEANERLFRTMADALPQPVVYLDAGLVLAYANPAFAALVDRPVEAIPGRSVAEILGETAAAALADVHDRALRGEKLVVERQLALGEHSLDLVAHYVPDRGAQGEVRGVYAVFQDVGAFRARERELRAARQQAEEADRAKTTFLLHMSHELRTPLNAIIGYAEIMEGGLLGPLTPARYKDIAGDIRTSAHHLLELITGVLDLAKVEHDQRDMHLEPVAVAEIAQEAVTLVGAPGRTRITCRVDTESRVHADRHALRQVLVNLLANAVKYGEGAPVFIEASGGGDTLALIVRDEGPGIAPYHLARLTQPFYRAAGDPLHATEGGTGIGLALSQGLATAMGGELRIDSQPGQGTAVWVVLPRAPRQAA